MELTPEVKAKIESLKNAGYSQREVLAYLGAEQYGEESAIHLEEKRRAQADNQVAQNSITWRDVVAAPANFLAPGAVDVFGSSLARTGVGTDTDVDVVREEVDEVTGRQFAGAMLQTLGLAADVGLTVGSLGAATPLTLGRNVALGAGLGYTYDVGEDLIEQEKMKDVLTPGLGTAIGAGAPVAFAGIGAGARALRPTQEATEVVADDVARAVAPVVRETLPEVAEEAAPRVGGVQEMGRQVGNRFTRAGRHLQSSLDDNTARNALRQGAPDNVLFALDEGIDTNTITRITQADDNARAGYRAVVEAAESGNPRLAETVSGDYAVQQYRIARNKQNEIGKALGEARRALGSEIIDETIYNPAMRTFGNTMRSNGINLKPNGDVEFATQKFIKEEEDVIREIWSRLARYDTISPTEVDEVAQFLSKLERRTNVTDKLDSVYIDVLDQTTGETRPVNLFRHVRNTYDNLLEQVDQTGEIAQLRRDYSQVKSITGDIENSWLRGINLNKATNEELADAMALSLRRLDSRAKSRTTYGQMARALDGYARGNGYTAADPSDISNFYVSTVEPMYRQTTPEASFRGSITGGIRSAFENVFDFGKANVDDKQKALRGLLDIEEVAPRPVNPAASVEEAVDAPQGAAREQSPEVRQSESSSNRITRPRGQRGFLGRSRAQDAADDVVLDTLMNRKPLDIVTQAGDEINADDVARLEALQVKARRGALNDEDLLEARDLLNKYGESF